MTWRTHLLFWMTIWAMCLIATPLLTTVDGQVRRIDAELAVTKGVFGDRKTDEISESATAKYRSLFLDTGILTEKARVFTKEAAPEQKKLDLMNRPADAFASLTNGYLLAFSVNVYGMLVRWGVITHWLLFIAPFLLAAFVDGFVIRKVKFSEFGFMSPMAYSMALHFIIFILFVPMLYLIAPLPITPYFMPGWALCLGLPIMLMISNTQRLLNA
jgi:hypothetical protein